MKRKRKKITLDKTLGPQNKNSKDQSPSIVITPISLLLYCVPYSNHVVWSLMDTYYTPLVGHYLVLFFSTLSQQVEGWSDCRAGRLGAPPPSLRRISNNPAPYRLNDTALSQYTHMLRITYNITLQRRFKD